MARHETNAHIEHHMQQSRRNNTDYYRIGNGSHVWQFMNQTFNINVICVLTVNRIAT